MSQKFKDILLAVNNSMLRGAIADMFAIVGVGADDSVGAWTPTSDEITADLVGNVLGDVEGNLVGNVTGNVGGNLVGNVTGDIIGDVKAADGATILNVGADITDAILITDVLSVITATPVNEVHAVGSLTIAGVVIHGETFTINSIIHDIWADAVNAYGGANVEVDITGAATLASSEGSLEIDAVVVEGEIVTIDSDVYEFISQKTREGGSTVDVDVSAYMTASSATITFANGDIHGDTVTIQAHVHTLKSDGTAGSASVVDISGAATIAPGVTVLTVGDLPADAETFTIGADVFEFDPADDGVAAANEIDTNGLTTIAQVVDKIAVDYNASGNDTCVAVSDNVSKVTFTHKVAGVASNIASTETMGDSFFDNNTLVGGADATGLEIAVIFKAHLDGAGAEANLTPTINAAIITMTWDRDGVVGDGKTLSETLTAGSVSGNTAGGADCSKANAQTAIAAVWVTGVYSMGTFGADISLLTVDIQGVAGDGKTTTSTLTGTGWLAAVSGSGADATATEAAAIIGALGDLGDYTLADAGGDVVSCTWDVAGVAGNLIAIAEAMAQASWDGAGGVLLGGTAAGVDATPGLKGEIRWDASYIYVNILVSTISSGNWQRASISAF